MSDRAGIPLRAEDALFLHAQSPLLCQQVGAVLLLEPDAALEIGALRDVISERVRAIPTLRHRLQRAPGRWRRPRWVADEGDIRPRIREVKCGQDGNPRTLAGIVDTFFSLECDPFRSPWEVWLIPGAPDGRTAVAVKIHHALGDSHAIIAALTKLLDPTPQDLGKRAAARRPTMRGPRADTGVGRGKAGDRARDAAARVHEGLRTMRGLSHLAAAGAAPEVSVCGPFTGGRRRYVQAVLPACEVARTARGLDTQIADLLLAVTAEALGRLLRARGEETAGQVVRIAVPRACPVRPRDRAAGTEPRNRTAAVTLDAPIGPAPAAQRLAAVRGQVAARVHRGDAAAAAMVLRVMNFLPLPLQRLAAVQFYQRRWFNLLVSVFPGARRGYSLLGARVAEAYPVLALADGAGLAIGAMTWGQSMSVGILADAALVPDVDKLAAEIPAAFELYRAAAQA
jgi:WS/DGAT/MGAT family acyltransferase